MEKDYLTDVQYTGDFYDHLAPAWLAYIATINGYRSPSIAGRFTWCELGCGKGITSLLLAALYPQGEFHACDFNAQHIEYADRLRKAAGVTNITFHARSFGEMLRENLPPFDFVALHGVYSWIPAEARAEVLDFLRSGMKPGGLAMVSYNAMPGWAHLQPLRHMMREIAETLPGNSLDKAREAYAFVDFLSKNGAGYFLSSPAATAQLKEIATQDIRYVAHEYLTPNGDPFYFSEVEQAMRGIGLSFAGSMTPPDNYVDSMAQPQFRNLLSSSPSRVALESRRDYIANTRFRKDLYAAQPAADRTAGIPLARFDGIEFCLVSPPERLAMAASSGRVSYDFQDRAASVRKVHALLDAGPASARAIHSAIGSSPEEASDLIQRLVISRHLSPCPPVRPAAGWMALNSALIDAAIEEKLQQIPLACPATGLASYSEVVQAAAIESAGKFDDGAVAARSVLARLREGGHPINRKDAAGTVKPATDDEVLEFLRATWQTLRDTGNPQSRWFRNIGLLA